MIVVIDGEIALGGGDLIVVVASDVDLEVLVELLVEVLVELLVDSVTIGSAANAFPNDVVIIKIATKAIFLDIFISFIVVTLYLYQGLTKFNSPWTKTQKPTASKT